MINPSIPNRTDNDAPHSSGYSSSQWEAGAAYVAMLLLAPIGIAVALTVGASFALCFMLLFAWIVGLCDFPLTLCNFTDADHTVVSIACILSTLTILLFIGIFILNCYIDKKENAHNNM